MTARAFHITRNNPKEGIEEYVSVLARKWVRDGMVVSEVGKGGTNHYHVYVRCVYPVRFNMVRGLFEGAHVEIARGSYRENEVYMSKQNEPKYFKVEESVIKWGDGVKGNKKKAAEGKGKGKGVWETVKKMIDSGMKVQDVVDEFPAMLMHRDKLERYANEKVEKRKCKIKCVYLFGRPGVGKTSMVYDVEGYEDVYRVVNYENPFDQYKGERVIVLDDYRGQLEESFLLALMDEYPVYLPCRYRDKYREAEKLYIVSNMEPRQIFGFFGFMVEAVTRRCSMILEITSSNRSNMKEVLKDED